jgi:hypothetical protein
MMQDGFLDISVFKMRTFVHNIFTGLAMMLYILKLIDFGIGKTHLSEVISFGENIPIKTTRRE